MSRSNICKIVNYVGDSSSGSLPVMTVNFDCGQLTGQETASVDCDYLVNEDATEKEVLLVSRKNQIYKGSPAPASEAICRTMYLVRNRRTGKAQLLSSSSCQLVNCTNSRNRSVVSRKDDGVDQRTKLIDTFGSKKAKRMSDIGARMKATTSNFNESLEKTVHGINDTIADIQNAEGNADDLIKQLLPPCDREAKDVSAVYPLDGLLSEWDLKELKPAAELYLNPPDDISKDKDFLVHKFFKSIEGNKSLLKAQLLVYANSLITFVRFHRSQLAKKDAVFKVCPLSKAIGLKIFGLFTKTSENRRVRTPLQADRAVCFAIVAILLACDYKIDLEWFFECLTGYRMKQVQGLMRTIGLVLAAKGSASPIYVLQLPLPPLLSIKYKKKRN